MGFRTHVYHDRLVYLPSTLSTVADGDELETAMLSAIMKEYIGQTVPRVGLITSILNIVAPEPDTPRERQIKVGDPGAYIRTTFRVLAFAPEVDELLAVKPVRVVEEGVYACYGTAMLEVFIPKSMFPEGKQTIYGQRPIPHLSWFESVDDAPLPMHASSAFVVARVHKVKFEAPEGKCVMKVEAHVRKAPLGAVDWWYPEEEQRAKFPTYFKYYVDGPGARLAAAYETRQTVLYNAKRQKLMRQAGMGGPKPPN